MLQIQIYGLDIAVILLAVCILLIERKNKKK